MFDTFFFNWLFKRLQHVAGNPCQLVAVVSFCAL